MGMLGLAGMVSGFGKGVGRGLDNLQTAMSQSMLQKERDDLERAREEITFGHNLGLLRERLSGERSTMLEREEIERKNALARVGQEHSFALDRDEAKQDETARQGRIEREEGRKRDIIAAQAAFEKELRDRGYKAEDAKREAEEKLAQWKREQQGKREERQDTAGLEIVKKGMDLQRPWSRGGSRADHYEDTATAKVLESRIRGLRDELKAFPTEEREKEIRKDIAYWEQQQNDEAGIQPRPSAKDLAGAGSRVIDTFAEKIAPQSSPTPQAPPANLPRMGNVQPTPDDIKDFIAKYAAAQQAGQSVSDVVTEFKRRFGRIPTRDEYARHGR